MYNQNAVILHAPFFMPVFGKDITLPPLMIFG